jgi:hypothetical protein
MLCGLGFICLPVCDIHFQRIDTHCVFVGVNSWALVGFLASMKADVHRVRDDRLQKRVIARAIDFSLVSVDMDLP